MTTNESTDDPLHLGSLLDSGIAAAFGATAAEQRSTPKSIGPYRVERLLGRGGMGEVYLAEQSSPVRRHVALKVVRSGSEGASVLARFAQEKEALARMSHSCIARVFDAGVAEDGGPYFVMEYVVGLPLTEFCDRERLGIPDRLRLFRDVCGGVQHAHVKGVAHRDLKPSNILVTREEGRVVPKIIDFGLARALAEGSLSASSLTVTGVPVGTLAYMSPEQFTPARLDTDARTDVFSLGVVLYELLVGRLPFVDGKAVTPGELERRIRDTDPLRPSLRVAAADAPMSHSAERRQSAPALLQRQLRGDLDWIVLRALEKDRERRYQTPSELADDIGRHLERQPLVAGPPGWRYRTGKFIARNRTAVIGAVLTLLALVVGLVVSAGFWLQARQEAADSRRVNEFWSDLLRSADPDESGREVTLLAVMTTAERRLRRGDLDNKPLLAARVLLDIARTQYANGRKLSSRRNLALAEQLFSANQGPVTEVAAVQREIARIDDDWERYDEAQVWYEMSLATFARHYGVDHPETLTTEQDLALLHQHRGDLVTAETSLTSLCGRAEKALGPDHGVTLTIRANLAVLLAKTDRAEAATGILRSVIGTLKSGGGSITQALSSLNALGVALCTQGKTNEAMPFLQLALEGRRKVLGPAHDLTISSAGSVAATMFAIGQRDAALQALGDLLAESTATVGAAHDQTLTLRTNRGVCLARAGRLGDAEAELTATLALGDGKQDCDPELLVSVCHTLGEILDARGEFVGAEAQLLRAHRLCTEHGLAKQDAVKVALVRLYGHWGQPEKASSWR